MLVRRHFVSVGLFAVKIMSPSFFDRGSGNNERERESLAHESARNRPIRPTSAENVVDIRMRRGFVRPSSNIIRRVYEEHGYRVLLDPAGRQLRYLTVLVLRAI